MPATDDDAALIAAMPPGTRVDHWKFGLGVVADQAVEYGQIPVQFPDRTVFCYPRRICHPSVTYLPPTRTHLSE